MKEVSKGECIVMGDFNHGHIQWNSLESTGGEDQQFLLLNSLRNGRCCSILGNINAYIQDTGT